MDTAHLLFAVLIIHGFRQRPYAAGSPLGRALISLSLINLAVLLARQAEFLFLTGRYPMALVLGLLLFAPHSITMLYRRWGEPAKPWQQWLFPVVSAPLASPICARQATGCGRAQAHSGSMLTICGCSTIAVFLSTGGAATTGLPPGQLSTDGLTCPTIT